eukprot:m.33893 g.33893  ORF g.33893 m.33893 type:complete len:372 (+) comp5150_c0_seq2:98-1213(+)
MARHVQSLSGRSPGAAGLEQRRVIQRDLITQRAQIAPHDIHLGIVLLLCPGLPLLLLAPRGIHAHGARARSLGLLVDRGALPLDFLHRARNGKTLHLLLLHKARLAVGGQRNLLVDLLLLVREILQLPLRLTQAVLGRVELVLSLLGAGNGAGEVLDHLSGLANVRLRLLSVLRREHEGLGLALGHGNLLGLARDGLLQLDHVLLHPLGRLHDLALDADIFLLDGLALQSDAGCLIDKARCVILQLANVCLERGLSLVELHNLGRQLSNLGVQHSNLRLFRLARRLEVLERALGLHKIVLGTLLGLIQLVSIPNKLLVLGDLLVPELFEVDQRTEVAQRALRVRLADVAEGKVAHTRRGHQAVDSGDEHEV